MKNLLIFFLLILSAKVNAQQYYNTSFVNGLVNKYVIHRVGNEVRIVNSNNRLDNIISKTTLPYYDGEMVDTKINDALLQNIFIQEIPSAIWHIVTLDRKSSVGVFFKFGTDGKIIEVSFSTQINSPISPKIFEKIENRIKREITASYSQVKLKIIGAPAYTTFNFISLIKDVYFR